MNNKLIDQLAKKIWNYQRLNHKIKKADLILVLGSHDIRVAKRGAQLYLQGYAPLLMFSGTGFGHRGDLLATKWKKSEAEIFSEIAKKMGVPVKRIIIEKESSNTAENIKFSRKLLSRRKIKVNKVIVVQKPYMERRAYATFKKVWPKPEVMIASPQLPYEKYIQGVIPKEDIINIMVGDLQRIRIYPKKGFQIYQQIPKKVWQAYGQLVKLGYTKHLVKR